MAVEGLPLRQELLADWRWLVPRKVHPIMMTAFGDLFFQDRKPGQFTFKDLMAGEFKVVELHRKLSSNRSAKTGRKPRWITVADRITAPAVGALATVSIPQLQSPIGARQVNWRENSFEQMVTGSLLCAQTQQPPDKKICRRENTDQPS